MGFLGTSASVFTDTNLVLQLSIIIILFAARLYAKRGRLKIHGLAMTFAVLLNAVAIVVVMVPSLLLGASALVMTPTMPLSVLSIFHAVVGGASEAIGAWIVLGWRLGQFYDRCSAKSRVMGKLLYAWLAAAVTGVTFYLVYYVALHPA